MKSGAGFGRRLFGCLRFGRACRHAGERTRLWVDERRGGSRRAHDLICFVLGGRFIPFVLRRGRRGRRSYKSCGVCGDNRCWLLCWAIELVRKAPWRGCIENRVHVHVAVLGGACVRKRPVHAAASCACSYWACVRVRSVRRSRDSEQALRARRPSFLHA